MKNFTKKLALITVLLLPLIVNAQFQIGLGVENTTYNNQMSVFAPTTQLLLGYGFNKHFNFESSFAKGNVEHETGSIYAYELCGRYNFAKTKRGSKFYALGGYTFIDANYKSVHQSANNGIFGLFASSGYTVVGDTSKQNGYLVGLGGDINLVNGIGLFFKVKFSYKNNINLFNHFDSNLLQQIGFGVFYNFGKIEKQKI